MNYKQVSYGSRGSDVTELQKLLNNNGYSLDTDGIFGEKTQAAVRDYQKKNSLSVDGIVGNNTWGSLTKQTSPQTNQQTPQASQQNDTVAQAQQMLGQNPGAYSSTWQGQLNESIQKILSIEPFSYDVNKDALYKQYTDQYINNGRLAMMDTMGQAQAMTGGYGNTYAQSAGQQAYQGYLQQLNDKVPELYGLALDRYQMEGDRLAQNYGLIAQQEEQDYGRYRDNVDAYINQRNFDYQKERDQAADERWREEFRYQKSRDQIDDARYLAQLAGGGEALTEEEMLEYLYAGEDGEKGMSLFDQNGKRVAIGNGINPYSRTINPDTANGSLADRPWQPNNLTYKDTNRDGKIDQNDAHYSLEKTVYEVIYNGKVEPVWKTGNDYWVWDEELNCYQPVSYEVLGDAAHMPADRSKTGGGARGRAKLSNYIN